MSIPHLWLLGFGVAALLLTFGAASGLVYSKLAIPEPLACTAFGIALSPLAAGLLRLDTSAATLRLPQRRLAGRWRGLTVALGPGMLLRRVACAAVGPPPRVCVLVGATIAPTDPVLPAPVVGGELAQRAEPADLHHAVTAGSSISAWVVAHGLVGVHLPALLGVQLGLRVAT